MAFLGGSVSLRSFSVTGKPKTEAALLDGLASRAFKEDEIGVSGETNIGWVTRRDLFDTEFVDASVLVEGHALFGLRVDRRAVPGSLLAAHVARMERAWMRENGKDFVPRSVRRDIKEEERSRLLESVPAIPSVHAVLWNLREKRVHFTTFASARGEELARLFSESFGLTLEPLGPEERADAIPGIRQRISGLSPLDFPNGHVRPADGDGDGSFLGRDFLTWVLHVTERDGGEIEIDGWGRLAIFFEDRMAFEGEEHSCRLQELRLGHPAGSAEAKTALLLGKKLVRARMTLGADDEETWKLTLDGDTLDLRSVKLPRTEATDPDGRLLERLDSIERIYDAVNGLYRAFLKHRTEPSFLEKEGPRLKEWLRTRRSDGDRLFR